MEKNKWDIRCVIYDCDGVMFDSLEANRRLYNYIANSLGRGDLTDEEIKYCHTHTVFESIKYIFKEPKQAEDALNFLKNNVQLKDFIIYLKMEPNLVETLATLKSKGIKRAVSTNRTTTMKHIMEKFNLWEYFDMVVTALDVVNPKPHPESVEKIISYFNIKKDHVVFIGDSEVDKETAQSAGIKFIAYKNREIQADAFIDDHLSLLGFLSNEVVPQ